jgi:hypothetical protein
MFYVLDVWTTLASPAPAWAVVCAVRACQICATWSCQSGVPASKKTFKDYEPGFVHIDTKYLPQMPDETARRYLFVAIDCATRWVYIAIYAEQTESSSVDFLAKVKAACPIKICKL